MQPHSPRAPQQIVYHPHTLPEGKAEERNLGDSCRGREEEKITRPYLLGLSCTLTFSFLLFDGFVSVMFLNNVKGTILII